MAVGIVATVLLATITRGGWTYAAAVFMIANIGIAASRLLRFPAPPYRSA
jgi:hypothetical protein